MNNYEKIEGKRKGSVNYVSEGFIFVKNLAVKDKIYLRCHRWRDQCKGTAEIHSGFLSIVKKCDHPPEHNAVKRRKTESVIKHTAETTCTSLRQIYDENANENLRPFPKIVSTLKKRRSTTWPAVPNNSEEFKVALSSDMGKIDDEYFFHNVITAGKEFALLFFTQTPCDIIESVSTIHSDATFNVVPKSFYQLLTIHCVVSDVLVPVFYVLMTAKCRTLYDAVFLQIRNNYPGFKPKKCVVDFETALYSSIHFIVECEMLLLSL